MIDFKSIQKPNLPSNKVNRVVVSAQYRQVLQSLEDLGIHPLTVKSCPDVLFSLRNHTDMLFSYLGNGKYVSEKNQAELNRNLSEYGFLQVNDNISLQKEYPSDIPLNFCIIDDYIICKSDSTPNFLKEGKNIINVRQGYAKCSCLVIDNNSLITDDASIFSAATNAGFDVLQVSKGSVKLEGLDVGFIGGCCGKISVDTIAFCGDIRKHSDFVQIDAFLRERNVYPLSLFDGDLIDIGSIIPISECI